MIEDAHSAARRSHKFLKHLNVVKKNLFSGNNFLKLSKNFSFSNTVMISNILKHTDNKFDRRLQTYYPVRNQERTCARIEKRFCQKSQWINKAPFLHLSRKLFSSNCLEYELITEYYRIFVCMFNPYVHFL